MADSIQTARSINAASGRGAGGTWTASRMVYREDVLICAACHAPFIVEYQAVAPHTLLEQLTVLSPCCSQPTATQLPQGTIAFLARLLGGPSVLGGDNGGA